MSTNEKIVNKLIPKLYESAALPSTEGWEEAYRDLSRLLSSGPGSLHFFSKAESSFYTLADTNEPGFITELNERLFDMAPFRDDFLKLRPGETWQLEKRFPGGAFRDTPFYRKHFKKHGIFHALHGCLIVNKDIAAGVTFTRPETMPNFSAEEVAVFSRILPHLQRAINLHINVSAMQNREHLLIQTFDKIPQPILVTDNVGKLVFKNRAAEEYFGDDGVFAFSRNGSVLVSGTFATAELKAGIEGAFKLAASRERAYGGVVALTTKTSHRPVNVLISPFSEPYRVAGAVRRYALLMISDPTGGARPLADDLRAVYRLTKKEAEIAIMLTDGKSIGEISELLGTSLHTVRTHVKHLLGKVGTTRQSTLVRQLLAVSSARSK